VKAKYRKIVFIVAYSLFDGKLWYVLLDRYRHWKGWEFPKGGVDQGEKMEDAVKRETIEETGLEPRKIKRFKETGKYKYAKEYPDRPGFIGSEYTLFSAEVEKGKINFDKREHVRGKWVSYSAAKKILRWSNQKKDLDRVNKYLIKMKKEGIE
jgi:8-oxo-dGTP pyrophosphatase MutT (NUDIX family)